MGSSIDSQSNGVFTCWKEIAAYVGMGVRTVQRWESRFGLPVRRPHANSHSIHILREELDHWLATRWAYRPRNPQPSNGTNGAGAKRYQGDIEEHRRLRGERSQLMAELRRDIYLVTDVCEALAQQVTHSRILRLQSVFALLDTKSAEVPPRNGKPARQTPKEPGGAKRQVAP